ncbi:MAG TPA: metallophosphoesterase [Gemmatimonadaceae bacterium]|nr:metallophosphoesterase [Gemmatimonadaceae bacterium]
MRLIHLADFHLGFRQYHRLTPHGINQREADVALAFRRAIDSVIALQPDVIAIAGDVFHSVRPMNPAIVDAFTQFARLRQSLPHAIIVMVAGNHDRPRATETGCILKLFSRLGMHVVTEDAERLSFPERELSVLAVPDQMGAAPPPLTADPSARFNVLVLHGEVEGVLPASASRAERATTEITRDALSIGQWSYIALGHYHVHREIAPNAYYCGSLDYTSANPWGELVEEREGGLAGKGFIEFDLATGTRRFHPLEPSRRLVDLPQLSARGKSAAELDAEIRERIEACEGGIEDKIVRLVLRDVPRHIVRDLDHKALRDFKRRALHFNLDARRPEVIRISASGAPGRRATLLETVEGYLSRRPLDGEIDRDALVRLGLQYLQEAAAVEQAATSPVPAS